MIDKKSDITNDWKILLEGQTNGSSSFSYSKPLGLGLVTSTF